MWSMVCYGFLEEGWFERGVFVLGYRYCCLFYIFGFFIVE